MADARVPLLGATVLLVGGRSTDRWGHLFGAVTPVLSFAVAVAFLVWLLGLPSEQRSRSLVVALTAGRDAARADRVMDLPHPAQDLDDAVAVGPYQ